VAFVVSDFLGDDYEHAAARGPREENLPDVGLALVEDLESGELVEVDTGDPRVRQAFAHEVLRQRALRERLFRKLRVDHLTVHTDEDYVRPIAEFFRFRQKRMMGFR
jgi:uncharacterized protein (DUF58 family)